MNNFFLNIFKYLFSKHHPLNSKNLDINTWFKEYITEDDIIYLLFIFDLLVLSFVILYKLGH